MTNSDKRCPSCNKSLLVTDENLAELVCSNCGFVLNEKFYESGPEWRNFSNEKDKSRVGSATSLAIHDMGLSTIIGKSNKDSTGTPLSTTAKKSFDRLRTWDGRSQVGTSQDRNLRIALTEMNKFKDKLALTDSVIKNASHMYRKCMEKKLVKGRTIHGVVGACVYASCRDTEIPRTLDDIAAVVNTKRKDIARCYRLIFRELELNPPVVDPIKGIARIASSVGLEEKTKRYAVKILTKAKKIGLAAGKDPMGLAAAALYLACIYTGNIKTQKSISIASGVTEVTIRNRCSGLKKIL